MPDSKLRRRIETALCESETKALAYMAEFYREMTASIGYRLRPQFNGDYMMMSAVGAAVIEGLGLRRIIAPRAVEQEFKFHGFGSPDIQNWSVASIGFTAIMFALIEPDPDFDEAILPTLKERLLAKKQEVEERLATDPQPMWARAED